MTHVSDQNLTFFFLWITKEDILKDVHAALFHTAKVYGLFIVKENICIIYIFLI